MWILYFLWQCTWGSLQTLSGLIVFLLHLNEQHYLYHGAVVTEWRRGGGLSLGPFIFLDRVLPRYREDGKLLSSEEIFCRMLVHEYGHTIQSMILGPFYLPVIGLPSITWNQVPKLKAKRRETGRSYYSFYTERIANALGEKVTKEKSVGEAGIY